ncbi:cytochrome P450 [Actinomadura rayongensis]|uniref:Cytochrome P450 n=1 Tax=Actinomadura rayongensis TaxID=1429076 RepID=A0A6I4WE99_9ACTN|nr:cytochrome P450 [Actinomadura rayongensis]MXQ68118.1 cytochrome P450 [Actinomadura rayongensis]
MITARSDRIPLAPGGVPLLGHTVPLLRGSLDFLSRLPAYGGVVGVRVGPLRTIVVCDPELTREFLRDDHVFDKGGRFFELARELAGHNLATCAHERHRRQRRLIQPAFSRDRFDGYGRIMTARSTSAASAWHNGQVLDVLPEMQKITLSTLVETMFCDELPGHVVGQAVEDLSAIFGGSYLRASVPSWLAWVPGFGKGRMAEAAARLRKNLAVIIAERRADGTDHGDLLSALLPGRAPDGREICTFENGFTGSEVSDQVMAFFGAGTDTTAAALAWTLHLVACHSEVQQRVQTEVDAVLNGLPPSLDDLPALRFTGRVVTEAMRLFPPAWILTRVITADADLGPYRLPAGSTVVCSPYLIHRRADLYSAPERFDPDRWDASRPQPPRYAYIPFGAGARKCIGDQFAYKEAVLALAAISSRWHLSPGPGRGPKVYAGVTLRPQGLRLRVTSRTK